MELSFYDLTNDRTKRPLVGGGGSGVSQIQGGHIAVGGAIFLGGGMHSPVDTYH